MDIPLEADDLLLFADPFTKFRKRTLGKNYRIELVRNGRDCEFDVDIDTGRIKARHRTKQYANIDSLLAGDEFANLHQFAQTVINASDPKRFSSSIPSNIKIGNDELPVVEIWSKVKSQEGKSNLILLDGPAGVGKTFQIEQLSFENAKKYTSGQSVPSVLHVSSRGRRLSNLPDVLASTTQFFGAKFGAKQVPALVRRGLLVVAIDGFDELVDADGYEDSWLALRRFLDETSNRGTVLLAARDTFVEEQELLVRIDRTKSDVSLSIAHVQPIEPDVAAAWLKSSPNWASQDFDSDEAKDILAPGSYALRPFFLRELREVKGWREVMDVGPRTFLVNRLVAREARLLSSQLKSAGMEEIAVRLHSLLREIALEMGLRESDAIEISHLGFLASYCFEDVLSESDLRKFVHKIGSLALLEVDGSESSARRFPHSEVEYFFLAGALIDQLRSRNIPPVLRRGVISADQLDVFEEVFSEERGAIGSAMNFLASAVSADLSNDGLSTNGGSLLTLGFGMGVLDRLDYLRVTEATFYGMAPVGKVTDCRIERLDIQKADLSEIEFSDCHVSTAIADEFTRFGESVPRFDAIDLRSSSGRAVLRKADVENFVRAHALAPADVPKPEAPILHLLDKLARRSMKHFYLKDGGEGDVGTNLLRDKNWPILREILESFGRVEEFRSRQMHGQPAPLIRIKNPRALLDASSAETGRIVEMIIDRARSN